MSISNEKADSLGRVWLFTCANIGFMMIIWLTDACLAALLPEIAEIYKNVSAIKGAQLVTIYNIGFMASSFFFGPLGDVLRRFKLIMLAGCLFLIVGIGFALVRSFPAALALRFGAGFCGGMLTVNLWSGLIHEVPRKHYNTAIGLMAGTRAYSFVLGLPLVMKLVDWIGWTPTFLLLGILVTLPLCLFAITSLRPPSLHKDGSLNPFVHFYETIRLPGIFRSLCGFFLVRTASSGPFVFLSLWLFETYGLDTGKRAILISIFGIGEILGSWASVPIIGRLGPAKTFIVGVIGTFLFLALLVFVPLAFWWIAVCLLALSLSDRCYAMAFWRIYMPQDRKRAGTLASMGNIAFASSIATATAIGAIIINSFGWHIAASACLALLFTGSWLLRFSLFTPERIAKANEGW